MDQRASVSETDAEQDAGKSILRGEVGRYVVNGAAATLIDFTALQIASSLLGEGMTWLAGGVGAAVGITASFLGSRYYVFPHRRGNWRTEVARFLPLYGVLALVRMALFYVWSDVYGLDQNIGFVIATGVQVVATFFGNKYLVFRNGNL
ncbi:MAG: GtrA family protein [Rhodobacteraceae bacterium]|nr:GtrA family protein [Paracoccaceae bacterium]